MNAPVDEIHFELFRSQGVQCVTALSPPAIEIQSIHQFNFIYAKSLNEKTQSETGGRSPGGNSRRGIAGIDQWQRGYGNRRAVEPSGSAALQPPSTPVELAEEPKVEEPRAEDRRGPQRDKIATSLNIAKLQAMQMSELNHMAKELGVENFGTMRKHEVIFHILQKNAERAGVLFSEGVLEVLPEGFGFCVRRVSITCPARRTFTFRRRKSAGSICRPAI